MELDFLQKNIDVTNLSNFKTKAKSKYYFEINNLEDINKLKDINIFCKNNNISILFIWAGTNLLFAFEEYNWVIVKNNLNWWNYDEKTMILESFTNERISDIAKDLEDKYNQNLWHRFIWLPWSIGWAVYWNAGCFWLETENNFLDADIYDFETWQIIKISKINMQFDYRSSLIKDSKNRYFIIKVRFDLSQKIEKYHSDVDNIDFRENKQPKWNTCWSFFKNPSKEFSAWALIEQVWLKWYKLWWAFFSPLHANFLMHDWNWTYKDLLNLVELAINKVKSEKLIILSPEVRIIFND